MSRVNPFNIEVLEEGKGFYYVEDGDTVSVSVKWDLESDTSVSNDVVVSFEFGEYNTLEESVIHKAIEKLKKNGRAKINVNNQSINEGLQTYIATHTKTDVKDFKLKSSLEIKLNDWEMGKRPWEKTVEERLSFANHNRIQGNLCFKAQSMQMSIRRYSRAIKSLIPILTFEDDDMKKRVFAAKLSCHLNLSMCHLRLGLWEFVVENASKALEIEQNNVKALYRRSVAYIDLNEFQKAENDLKVILTTEPSNKAALEQMARLQIKVKKHDQKLANLMKKYLEGDT